ncbi:hypothetical protein BDP27DRAFT_696821 [Rhodocollybia butyracea]|uniref:Uncharacterized protein n=1 Tax=Rhodocollybia butyracea TaxID=206335 RepID=A0A9P5UDZ7_9AGAR|nr:hypothetical protein BDP27DRAFT_696821 [Rhodocollybia butyracea]
MDPASSTTPTIPFPPLIRRDKSYRKPVPEYIPSPPTSPMAATPDLPKVRPEYHESELPPLPGDWQNVLQAAVTQEKEIDVVQVVPVPSDDAIVFSRHHSFQLMSSTHVEVFEKSPSIPTSPNGTKRRLPQTYRPPTPPINSATENPKIFHVGDSSVDNHDFLTVPRQANLIKGAESSSCLYPPLARTATSASSNSGLYPPLVRSATAASSNSGLYSPLARTATAASSASGLYPPLARTATAASSTSGLYPPLTRTATAAGSSRSSFHPVSAQASFRTARTIASESPTFIARTNDTSHHTDEGHREDNLHDLPVLSMHIVRPPRRRGSGLTGSTKVGSVWSLKKVRFGSCWSVFRDMGSFLRDAFCCCFSGAT